MLKSIQKPGLLTFVLFLVLSLLACAGKTKKESSPSAPGPTAEIPPAQGPTPPAELLRPDQATQAPTDLPAEPVSQPSPQDPLPVSSALPSTPSVGIILGPGGLKALAHIGVLKELEAKRITIKAIAGLEWGALIAALYAVKARVNDVQWQIAKLKKDDQPQKSLFTAKISPEDPNKLSNFLEQSFADRKLEDAQAKFFCPVLWLPNGALQWHTTGGFVEVLKTCLPQAPLLQAYQTQVAAAFELAGAIEKMRSIGVQIIIFVDVLAGGTIIQEQNYTDAYASQTLWWQGRLALNRQKSLLVSGRDIVINVDTRNFDLSNFEANYSLQLFGQQAAKPVAEALSQKYGF